VSSGGARLEILLVMVRRHTLLPATVLVATLSAGCSSVCCAQSKVQPSWMASTRTSVKPERKQEFEGYLKQLMAAHRRAGTAWFLTFDTFAGDTTEYTTIVPVMKFGDLDGPSVGTAVLGQPGWERLSRNMARCTAAQTRHYATPQADLEINRAEAPAGIYWVETSTLVAPGRMSDYLNWLRDDYRPALEKAGVARFQVWLPIFGAAAGEIVTTRMLENLAEIDAGAVLSRALSADEVRNIAAKSAALVTSSYTRIVRVRNDLSYSADK